MDNSLCPTGCQVPNRRRRRRRRHPARFARGNQGTACPLDRRRISRRTARILAAAGRHCCAVGSTFRPMMLLDC